MSEKIIICKAGPRNAEELARGNIEGQCYKCKGQLHYAQTSARLVKENKTICLDCVKQGLKVGEKFKFEVTDKTIEEVLTIKGMPITDETKAMLRSYAQSQFMNDLIASNNSATSDDPWD